MSDRIPTSLWPTTAKDRDLRFNRKNVTLKHHSSRGRVQRNSGDFTRGSQLVTHEFWMWFAGVRIPAMTWFGIFMTALVLTLWFQMGEHEVQLVLMKAWSDVWMMMDFDPQRIVNLTLPTGTVKPMAMHLVPFNVSVDHAWSKVVRCVVGSGFMAVFIAAPLTMWFVDFSRRRGRSILEERHERGALLVERETLVGQIHNHNGAKLVEECLALEPPVKRRAARKLTSQDRQQLGIHRPYTLGALPYPWRLEQSHTMLIGTTGTGKTTQLRSLTAQIRERGCRAVIFDLTGSFVEAFYNPDTDVILNPMDERMPPWNLFDECRNYAEWVQAAAAIVPSNGGGDQFWVEAARTLFVEMCIKLQEMGETSNGAIAYHLMNADLKSIHEKLADTPAGPLTSKEVAKMAQGIRSHFNANGQAFGMLPDALGNPLAPFSIVDWITGDFEPGSILFITCSYSDLEFNRTMLTLWMDLAVNSLLKMPKTRDLRTWFLFDEVHALHRLPAIEHGLQTARGVGGAFVLGMHSFDKLVETYGEQGAVNLSGLARTKLILATADRKTAETCSEFIGNREVRQMDEAYSYGYNNTRDASTLTPRKLVEPLVIPDDIANLPSMHGFVKFPDGFPAARIQLRWKNYPEIAAGFQRRQGVKRTQYHPPVPAQNETGAEDETESARADADKVGNVGVEKTVGMREMDARAQTLEPLSQAEIDADNMFSETPKPAAVSIPPATLEPATKQGQETQSSTIGEEDPVRAARVRAMRESYQEGDKDKASNLATYKDNEKAELTTKTAPENGKQGLPQHEELVMIENREGAGVEPLHHAHKEGKADTTLAGALANPNLEPDEPQREENEPSYDVEVGD